MKPTPRTVLAAAALAALIPILPAASPLPAAKPEEVGLSSERLQRIHEMVMRRVDARVLPGAVTLVARRGRVVHFEAHGVMDLEAKKPMPKDALFRLASSSKPITATAILILLEEGKLKLTDPVARYIPEFANSKVAVEFSRPPVPMADRAPKPEAYYTVPATREITIVDLLTHTSGLVSGGITNADYAKLAQARKPTDTLADFIPLLGNLPLDFQPGTQWRYSGSAGFDTLGRIVEIASGMSFDQFLRQRLFEPLGMKDTCFRPAEKDLPRLASIYYRRTPNGLDKPSNSPLALSNVYFSGAGGLVSTVEDYLAFAQMLANGGQLNGKRILSPWTVNTMLSNNVGGLFNGQIGRPPQGMGFGLGGEVVVNAVEARMRKPSGSYGWDGAFGTYWWVNPKEQMVAIYFVQVPGREHQYEFDNAVAQAVIE